jgi:hypothetical protein
MLASRTKEVTPSTDRLALICALFLAKILDLILGGGVFYFYTKNYGQAKWSSSYEPRQIMAAQIEYNCETSIERTLGNLLWFPKISRVYLI